MIARSAKTTVARSAKGETDFLVRQDPPSPVAFALKRLGWQAITADTAGRPAMAAEDHAVPCVAAS